MCWSVAAITMQPPHEISADRWPDHVQLSDIERRFVCKVCSKRGAEVRPDFRRRMGTDAYISFEPFPVRRDVCLRSGRPPDLFNHFYSYWQIARPKAGLLHFSPLR